MMKNKFKLYGIIVLVAIIGLSMVACDVGTSPTPRDADPNNFRVIYDKASGWQVGNLTITNGANADKGFFLKPNTGYMPDGVPIQGLIDVSFTAITVAPFTKVVIYCDSGRIDYACLNNDDPAQAFAESPATAPRLRDGANKKLTIQGTALSTTFSGLVLAVQDQYKNTQSKPIFITRIALEK